MIAELPHVRGNFSIVKLAINKKTGDQYAVKIIGKDAFCPSAHEVQ